MFGFLSRNLVLKGYSSTQFAIFRMIFGGYLFFHFFSLINYSEAIWGRNGMFPEASLNMTYPYFPNILFIWDSPLVSHIVIVLIGMAALGICLGVWRPMLSLYLWYGWACLFHRNNLILNPSVPIVGWLLLALAIIPTGERWVLGKKEDPNWGMPSILIVGAWVIMGVGYMVSGLDKCLSPSWQNGTAIFHLLNNPLARDTALREFCLGLDLFYFKVLTFSTLTLEMVFGILCLFKKSRPLAWIAMCGFHLGILLLVDFADLTIGVMMIHLFVIETEWVT